MIIYKDAVTGDEMFSDAYKPEVTDDCLYTFRTEMKKFAVGGGIDLRLIGGNASAEGDDDEGVDDSTSTLHQLEVVHQYNLKEDKDLTKSQLTAWLKDYLKHEKIKKAIGGDPARKKQIEDFYKFITKKEVLSQMAFFKGESQQFEGSYLFVRWDDDTSAQCYAFIDGLVEEKQ